MFGLRVCQSRDGHLILVEPNDVAFACGRSVATRNGYEATRVKRCPPGRMHVR